MSRKNEDKPIKPSRAAKLLAVGYPDLPHLDRQWTRRDVYALRSEKPSWLTDARGRRTQALEATSAEGTARVEGLLELNGLLACKDDGSEHVILHVDKVSIVLSAAGVDERDVDSAIWHHWPSYWDYGFDDGDEPYG